MSTFNFVNNVAEFTYKGAPYEGILKPGIYRFEAYGASGGAYQGTETTARDPDNNGECLSVTKNNNQCHIVSSQAGAGGYIAGTISLSSSTKVFIYVGGKGNYGNGRVAGGFNGGGDGYSYQGAPAGSGGGATDFRLVNDSLYNRILVAGAGGGSDSYGGDGYSAGDGTGGSGGLPGQGMWNNGAYLSSFETTSLKGYQFGKGQGAISQVMNMEQAGAGSGFFGGSMYVTGNAGGGGGSSFAFSATIPVPEDEIESINSVTGKTESKKYAFLNMPQYIMYDIFKETGVWSGNGFAMITLITLKKKFTCESNKRNHFFYSSIMCLLSYKNK